MKKRPVGSERGRSALGFTVLLDLTAQTAVLKTTLVSLLFAGATFHGVLFAHY